MTIEVRLFAMLRDRARSDTVRIELSEGATVGELKRELAARHPELAALVPFCLVAIDRQYAVDATSVRRGQEIALIPPVSGG